MRKVLLPIATRKIFRTRTIHCLRAEWIDTERGSRNIIGSWNEMPPLQELESLLLISKESYNNKFVWIEVIGNISAIDQSKEILESFHLPPLLIEDALNIRQRAKIEIDSELQTAFVLLKIVNFNSETSFTGGGIIDRSESQISIFSAPSFIISLRLPSLYSGTTEFIPLNIPSHFAKYGPQAIIHGILDSVVDTYIEVEEQIVLSLESIEESIFSPTRDDEPTSSSQNIYCPSSIPNLNNIYCFFRHIRTQEEKSGITPSGTSTYRGSQTSTKSESP